MIQLSHVIRTGKQIMSLGQVIRSLHYPDIQVISFGQVTKLYHYLVNQVMTLGQVTKSCNC